MYKPGIDTLHYLNSRPSALITLSILEGDRQLRVCICLLIGYIFETLDRFLLFDKNKNSISIGMSINSNNK